LVGKTEGKKPLGRLRHMKEDNTEMDLGDIRWDIMDWLRIGTSGGLLQTQ
jgi:hypothetical protein